MDSRKPHFWDHSFSVLSSKRGVVSGFGLGVLACLVVVSCLVSVNTPPAASSPSLVSWFSSVSYGVSHSGLKKSVDLLLGSEENVVTEKTHDGNPSKRSFTVREPDSEKTHQANLTGDTEGSSSLVNAGRFPEKTHDENSSKSYLTGREPDLEKIRAGNSTADSKDSSNLVNSGFLESTRDGNLSKSSFIGKDGSGGFFEFSMPPEKINEASPTGGAPVLGKTHLGNTSKDDDRGRIFEKKDGVDERDHGRNGAGIGGKNASHGSDEGNASERMQEGASRNNGSGPSEKTAGFSEKCNIFDGRWVRDESKPYYPAGSCPYIDTDFDCHKNGRPDDGFLRWRWQPYGCNIPRLNATDFLERLRGKRFIFVGDSLNRNMWESLVCILRNSVKHKTRVYEVSGRSEFKTKGYYAFRFEDYNCSVDFVRSPFLVREIYLKNVNGLEDERLRLDLLDETTSAYTEAEIIVFNTGHWWTHDKTSRGIDYYQEGNHVYPVLKAMEAYKKALNTWARWVDKKIDSNKTRVVFRGYSLTHFRGGQWNSGGQCHKETQPIFNESFLAKYPSKMRALEQVLENMKTPVLYLNISRLTDYRKDGHPSIYRKAYKTVEEQIAAEKSQDCSHWCLPGIPDTWNELLYASLLMDGQGPWGK